MLRPIHAALALAALATAACTDSIATDANSLALTEAFQSVPVGFSANSNSFDPAGDHGVAFMPGPMTRMRAHAGSGQGGQKGQGGMGQGGMGQGGRGLTVACAIFIPKIWLLFINAS